MRTELLTVTTGRRPRVHDLTAECEQFVGQAGDGLLSVFVPHASAGLALIETGGGSDADLLLLVDHLAPADSRWNHQHGSPGHGRDHVLPAILSPSVVIPVTDGRLQMGPWQSVCLVDTNIDNPHRHVRLTFLPAGTSAVPSTTGSTSTYQEAPLMRLSARNQLPGTVVSVDTGAVMSHRRDPAHGRSGGGRRHHQGVSPEPAALGG